MTQCAGLFDHPLRPGANASFVAILRAALALAASGLVAGCSGRQSALDPGGSEAASVATLFWVMLAGAALVWIVVIGIAIYAARFNPSPHSETAARRFVLWGGAVFPTVVLTCLLAFALWLMPNIRQSDADALRIEIVGEQFWWRVHYWPEGAEEPIVTANEIRMPVGRKVEFVLGATDVIHSFWIPSLGGKMDMIPGRENSLTLDASRPGVYRGACAEFCGESHALMALEVVALQPAEFESWLEAQAAPAMEPVSDMAARGMELFSANGCGACHAVRGTRDAGTIGPDLTHVGSRRQLAAATLANDAETLAAFIATPDALKPGIKMPGYAMLPEDDIAAIAAYLESLQ